MTASFQLENIINDFESTKSAHLASFYLGKIKYNYDEMDAAKKYLEAYLRKNSNDIMNESSSKLLADIHFRQNDLLSAIKVIDTSLKSCNNLFNCRSLKIKKAFYLIAQNNHEAANKLLADFNDKKDLDPGQKKEVEQLFGRISG
tara:strand:- start:86 stop:520 length:435 start_codon:yes stop_codon:yes gene_type:complete